MALNKQLVPISFFQGVDFKTDRKQVVPGKLLLLQNAIFTSPGKLQKRNGYAALSSAVESGPNITNGAGIATFKDELIEFDGTFLYSYAESNLTWVNKGRTTSLEVTQFPVIRNAAQQTAPDMAQHPSGLQAFTWKDSRGGYYYSIYDSVTGQAVVQDVSLGTNSLYAKPFALGGYLLIIYINTTDHNMKMISIPVVDPVNPAAPVNVATNVDVTFPTWDGNLFSDRLYIVYNNSDGGGGISYRSINKFLVVTTATDITGENADVCIGLMIDITAMQAWIAYYNGTAVKYTVRTLGGASVVAPTVVETLADVKRLTLYVDSGSGTIWYEVSASETYNERVRKNTATNTGTVGTPANFLLSVGLAGKAFTYLGVVYIPLTFETVQQPTYFIATSLGNIIAKLSPLQGGGLLTTPLVPEVVQPTSGIVSLATLQKDLLTTIGGTVYTQTGVTADTLNFNSFNSFQTSEIANGLQITGGLLSMYDGVNVVELGFNVYPEEVTSTSSTTGGGLGNASVATQYQYSVTYEWTDNQGQLHRSFPSIPDDNTTVDFTSGVTTGQVTLTIPTLRLTQKSGVVIAVYRTEGNGTIFYQLTSIGLNTQILNDPTIDSITYVDGTSDADIIGNPILYTTGGVVGNDAPPAPSLITQFINRLMLVPSENPNTIWFSEEVVPGTPLQFSQLFVLNIDNRGGPITAIQQMDGNLIIFKESLIFYLNGEGPDNTGGQNDFSGAQLITTDSGCINARSLVIMPLGIMYQSHKGIYLLRRDLSVEFIGADVQTLGQLPITSAVLTPNTNQVRFTLTNSDSQAIVYDYYVKQWSVFTNHNTTDAVVFEDVYTYTNPNGLVYQETPGQYTDNGSFIPLKLTTSWLSMASLQGFQRCYRALFLGEYISPHTLEVGVAYDFDSSIVQQDLINAGSLFNLTTYGEDSPYGEGSPYGGQYPLYEFRIDFQRQKCTAIQFTLQDAQSTNLGEGLSLSAFNLMVGTKMGSNKLRPANIYS